MPFLVKVERRQEVIDTIEREVYQRKLANASITVIGAVQEATVSVMKKDKAQEDYLREYDQPLELSGTGEVVDGKVHLHVTLYGEDFVVGGHLHSATVKDFFVHAYVNEVS